MSDGPKLADVIDIFTRQRRTDAPTGDGSSVEVQPPIVGAFHASDPAPSAGAPATPRPARVPLDALSTDQAGSPLPDPTCTTVQTHVPRPSSATDRDRAALKFAVAGAFLRRGVTSIRLDSGAPGVRVPADLRGRRDLLLKFSWRFSPPDMVLDSGEYSGVGSISATLHFPSTGNFRVHVPWSAVWQIEDVLFLLDVPHSAPAGVA